MKNRVLIFKDKKGSLHHFTIDSVGVLLHPMAISWCEMELVGEK